MAYSLNPYLPKVRAKAVELIREQKWSAIKAANYLGVHRATVHRWLNKAPDGVGTVYEIPTQSSKPKASPLAVSQKIVDLIIRLRLKHQRCAEIIHAELIRMNILISLSTVKRVLRRNDLINSPYSPWRKYHLSGERPQALNPGQLVEMDSIHLYLERKKRNYIFTMLDCYSRWGYAKAVDALNPMRASHIVNLAEQTAPFKFHCIQSDHGQEFSGFFTHKLDLKGIQHRLIRIRKPNDNAHVERFNRTLQDELKNDINKYKDNIMKLNQALKEYLNYYNSERLHLGLGCKTPQEVLQRC
jgi:transposase InsO family protein